MAEVISKDEVVAELERLQSEGHSMKVKDFDSRLYRGIQTHFGGYKNAKKELDIEQYHAFCNHTPEEMKTTLQKLSDEGLNSQEVRNHYPKLCQSIRSQIGGLNKACDYFGIQKFPPPSRKGQGVIYTEKDIRKDLEDVSNGTKIPSSRWLKSNGYYWLVSAVRRNYGSWNEGLTHFGYEPYYVAGKTDWTSEELIVKAKEEISKGCKPTVEELGKRIRGFRHQVTRLFGGYEEFRRQAGYSVISVDKPRKRVSNKYRPDLQTEVGVIREITRLWYIGAPLNYYAIRKLRKHLLKASNVVFGSWELAVESSGISYATAKKSSNVLAEQGETFEGLLGEILTELNVTYTKYSHETLRPDFVLEGNCWVDAKLSEWTDCSEMLKKYLPECSELTVVYLRGRRRDRVAGTKYRHRKVSVYKLIEGLTEDRRKYYEDKLREIERQLEAT